MVRDNAGCFDTDYRKGRVYCTRRLICSRGARSHHPNPHPRSAYAIPKLQTMTRAFCVADSTMQRTPSSPSSMPLRVDSLIASRRQRTGGQSNDESVSLASLLLAMAASRLTCLLLASYIYLDPKCVRLRRPMCRVWLHCRRTCRPDQRWLPPRHPSSPMAKGRGGHEGQQRTPEPAEEGRVSSSWASYEQ